MSRTATAVAASAALALEKDPEMGEEARFEEAYQLIGTVVKAAADDAGVPEDRVRGALNPAGTAIVGWEVHFPNDDQTGRPAGYIQVQPGYYVDDDFWEGGISLDVQYAFTAWSSPGTVHTSLRDLPLWLRPILDIAQAVAPR
jgi:hypothetical protein